MPLEIFKCRIDERVFLVTFVRDSDIKTIRFGSGSKVIDRRFISDYVILGGRQDYDIEKEFESLLMLNFSVRYISLPNTYAQFKNDLLVYDEEAHPPGIIPATRNRHYFPSSEKLMVEFSKNKNIYLSVNGDCLFDYNKECEVKFDYNSSIYEIDRLNKVFDLFNLFSPKVQFTNQIRMMKSLLESDTEFLERFGIEPEKSVLKAVVGSKSMELSFLTDSFIKLKSSVPNAISFSSNIPLKIGTKLDLRLESKGKEVLSIPLKVFSVSTKYGQDIFLSRPFPTNTKVLDDIELIKKFWGVQILSYFVSI